MAAMQQLQQQMQEMQNRLNQAMEEQKYNVSAINKVKLTISDKEFITNSKTLSNEQHGNTLFVQSLSQISNEGGDKKANDAIQLYFDRNPSLFGYVLDYLRGYDIKSKLRSLKIFQLESLRDDAIYYRIKGLEKLVMSILCARFNPDLCSQLIELSQNSITATRKSTCSNRWQSVAIYGSVSGTASRYVEIDIVTDTERNIRFGVTETSAFKRANWPGRNKENVGCYYNCSNGNIYRSVGGNESLGSNCSAGDKIGALVKLNQESNMATIAFYKNGKMLKQEYSLKTFMDVSKGVMFVVSLYASNEIVSLVEDPVHQQ